MQRRMLLLLNPTEHRWKGSDHLKKEGLSPSGLRKHKGNQAWRQGLDEFLHHLGVFVVKLNALKEDELRCCTVRGLSLCSRLGKAWLACSPRQNFKKSFFKKP